MDFETLLYEVKNNVCTITLNRPDVYNAFNDKLTFEMQDALKHATRDQHVRVVVITGAGKAFCSGQDLKAAMEEEKRSFINSVQKRYNPMIKLMRDMPKPIICRLNGVAAGAGCSLALACDMIIADEEAKLIEVFVNIGLVMDSGSSFFLPRAVGSLKAFEMATMGTRVKAKDAVELGLVNKAVPADELDAAVEELTDYYANAPTMAIGIMKKMLNRSYHSSLEEMLDYEGYCQEIAGNSEDYKEGVQAFLEKRKPKFRGR